MGFIGRVLPGELDGTLDPRDYGFEVIRDETPLEDRLVGAAALYQQVLHRTGTESPRLDELLKLLPYDPEPARLLIEKNEALPNPYGCRFGDAELETDRGVFSPTLTNVSPFLFKNVVVRPGERVLDAFAGSGAFAINAALGGAKAVAYDISPAAVACAKKNARKNNVSENVEVRQGTLHEVIAPSEQFDVVIANPPLVPGDPQNPLEQALFDDGLAATKELVAALPSLLTKGGRCYLSTSSVIERNLFNIDIEQICHENGLAIETIAKLHRPYESYRVHRIEHPSFATRRRAIARRIARWYAEH
jgi:methylase of polypeptide subunit release factors